MSVGKNIKRKREEMGLYQSEVAEKIALSMQYISAIETGRKKPGLQALIKLAGVFDCSLDELVHEEIDAIKKKAV